MASGTSRTLFVSILLVAAIAVGYLLHPKASLAKNWNIKVGGKNNNNPCELNDDYQGGKNATLQRISKKNKDSIKWHATGNQNLYIVLHLTVAQNCPVPFDGLTPLNLKDAQGRDLYLVGKSPGKQFDSGPVVDGFSCYPDNDDPKTWIKYDQYLETGVSGVYQSCDGMIIIDP